MRLPSSLSLSAVAVTAFVIIALMGCGGGSNQNPTAPVIVSQPPVDSGEGQTYSYQLVAIDPAGENISYSLISAPAGAVLTGNTVTWTPSPSQSRQPNNFVVTATNAGGSSSQSWTVTPVGTIHVTQIDTIWTEEGSTVASPDWTRLPGQSFCFALVTLSDGTDTKLTCAADAGGGVKIPNVPAGYYWLQVHPGIMYSTSSSAVDLGGDYTELSAPRETNPPVTTTLQFNVSGIKPEGAGVLLYLPWGWRLLPTPQAQVFLSYFQPTYPTTLDFSQVKTAAALQYVPVQFGPVLGAVVDSVAVLTNLSITNGSTARIDLPLTPAPTKSVSFTIRGQDWQSLLAHIAPGPLEPSGTLLNLFVTPHAPSAIPPYAPVRLMGASNAFPSRFYVTDIRNCSTEANWIFDHPPSPDLLFSDVEMTSVQYIDPFPDSLSRYFEMCQQVYQGVTTPSGAITEYITLTNRASWASPPPEVGPLIGPVEEPTINGQPLFTAATLSAQSYTLKWRKPSLGNATEYRVQVFRYVSNPVAPVDLGEYSSTVTFYTSQTSMTLPPETIERGNHYFLMIRALTDGRANFESSPLRHAFPMGHADVMSAVFTIQ